MIGIDYADLDGNHIAAPAAVAGGARFVGMRGAYGYGTTAQVDPTPARDATSWRSAGAQVFAYLCINYTCLPEIQADALAASYTRQGSDLPVALDLEVNAKQPGITPATRVAWAERAVARLQQHYGAAGVWIYTSLEQWLDNFGDLDSTMLGALPLWLKTPYPWNPRNIPHVADTGPLGELPRPWRRAGSPGAWAQQFQGDAIGFPGMSSTVDISRFLPAQAATNDPRWLWVTSRFFSTAPNLQTWQSLRGLTPDGVVGPATLAQFCR